MVFEWWDGLALSAKIFAAVAIPATVIMFVQAVLLLIGIGVDTDIDGDGVPDAGGGDDGLGLISVRGIVAFFSIGGWSGFAADAGGLPVPVSTLIALTAGTLSLLGVAILFKSIYKLQGSGNLSLENAVGKTGKVYLTVPPKGKGHGKINVIIQDRLAEVDAVNDGDEEIHTGESVFIASLDDPDTVVVRKAENGASNNIKTTKGGISQWDSRS